MAHHYNDLAWKILTVRINLGLKLARFINRRNRIIIDKRSAMYIKH